MILLFQACLKYVEECESKVLDDTLTTELLSLSATLVSSQIVSHKQQEVPLLSACILISIILLFPDDMPFGEDQSKVCACYGSKYCGTYLFWTPFGLLNVS